MLRDLELLVDDVEKKLGEDDDTYCELSHDYQDIIDSIRSLTRKADKILAL